ncbi:MAG: ABC transporter ATP-binding protein [Anaerolineae bacterium]
MAGYGVRVDALHFRYLDSPMSVLNGIDMEVQPGETVLILGPSGCGKSTLALCLNGLIPHDIPGDFSGEVWIGSHMTLRTPPGHLRQLVGIVFQDPETQLVMPRVDEEVAFGLENIAIPAEAMRTQVGEALNQVGLAEKTRARVETLSGGQKQRLALASVLAMRPSVLILDEPTANLDPLATLSFYQTLRVLRRNTQATILLIEHRIDAALPLVDRVVVLSRDGRVLAAGTPRDIYATNDYILQREGIWLPTSCRLASALRSVGWPLENCPLTIEEMADALRSACPSLSRTGGSSRPGITLSTSTQAISGNSGEAISVEGVSFTYPDGTVALEDVHLHVPRGSFFALVGANGSGKTTLARILVGLLPVRRGKINILGQEVTSHNRSQIARQVGYVFQNPEHQFITERVVDELTYSLDRDLAPEEENRRIERLLERFGLKDYRDFNPFSLSQGQKRRLSVATMVAMEQPILILDEPTFGQDYHSAQEVMSVIRSLQQAGTTILCITHDMQLVADYAQEVAVMERGRVIFQGTPHALFQQLEVLSRAGLDLPPLAILSSRLGLDGLYTIEDWLRWAAAHTPVASPEGPIAQ